ncbi:MAG: hypothetical protein J6C44_04010 [Muribaculaceae bacterium]|nr:hypothetical protein [Muribaculaceae bacterium]
MNKTIEWIIVGLVIIGAVIGLIIKSRAKKNSCHGCSLADQCNSRPKDCNTSNN